MDPIVWTELISVAAIVSIAALTIGNIVATSGWQRLCWLMAGLVGVTAIAVLTLGAVSQWH